VWGRIAGTGLLGGAWRRGKRASLRALIEGNTYRVVGVGSVSHA
jgi:hypothetical protein